MSTSTESQIGELSKHMMSFHHHPLFTSDCLTRCNLCEGTENGIGYECSMCNFMVHKECVEPFVNQPFKCNHFLKFFHPSDDEVRICHFCPSTHLVAGCKICNIRMCLRCIQIPPPLSIFQEKHHKHTLTLLLKLITYTCNACGLEGDRNPYVCLECNMTIHKDCIDLPRVININRHDHRISHTFHLGETEEEGDDDHWEWECGVCRKTIDGVYGAFKCFCCPSYAVHSKCATRKEVWDGKELEDVPEEEEIIEDPFKVVNKNGDIIHFSHENHILEKLNVNSVTDIRCKGCFSPINGDPCYKCADCEFVLHKTCANLSRKKRVLLHNHKLNLRVDSKDMFCCKSCLNPFNGFRYACLEDDCKDDEEKDVLEEGFDVRCSSLSEPFQHDLHPHPLYLTLEGLKECKACGKETKNPYRCVVPDCDYGLCMRCASLPRKVKSRYDDHYLKLSQDIGNGSGDLWCDICETKTDPKVCYYTCDECGVTLHIHCVLGYIYYTDVGVVHTSAVSYSDIDGSLLYLEVLSNIGVTRPLCNKCKSRCRFPFSLKVGNVSNGFQHFCSYICLD